MNFKWVSTQYDQLFVISVVEKMCSNRRLAVQTYRLIDFVFVEDYMNNGTLKLERKRTDPTMIQLL